MTWAASGRRLGYQAHYVVYGGKARVVLNVLVDSAEVTENRPMLDLRRTHHAPFSTGYSDWYCMRSRSIELGSKDWRRLTDQL